MVDQSQGFGAGLGVNVDGIKERALEATATAREKLSGGTQFLRDYIVKEPVRGPSGSRWAWG